MFNDIYYFIKHPEEIGFSIKKHRRDFFFWILVFIVIFCFYHYVTKKRWNGYFQILASSTQLMAFAIILLKCSRKKTVSGLSANTIISYCLVLICRLTANIPYKKYMARNNYRDGIFQSTEILSLIICLYLLYMLYFKYNETADIELDKKVRFYYFAIPCYIFAIFFRSAITRNAFCDINWAFSNYLETFAVFPQIFLFYTKKSKIENFTGHFVSLCGLSRIFSVIFWWNFYDEIETYRLPYDLDEYSGTCILVASILQLVIMADFYFLYFKSLIKGEEMNTMDI